MALGERIGDAYVRIHASGKGMKDDIRRDFDPIMKGAGEEGGKSYWKAFNDQTEKQGKNDLFNFAKNIKQAFGKFDAGNDFIDNFETALEELRRRVGDRFGPEIGQRFADELREAMQRGAIQTRKDYVAAISDIRPAVARLAVQIDKENQEAARARVKLNERTLALIKANEEKAAVEQRRRDQQTLDFTVKMQKQRVAEDKKVLSQVRELEDAVQRLATGNSHLSESYKSVTSRSRDLVSQLKHVESDTTDADHAMSKMRLRLISIAPRIDATNRGFGRMADVVGTITGRGSRNNFLNFVGSVNRNILRLTGTLVTGVFKAGKVLGAFFNEVRQGGISLKDVKTLTISAVQAIAGGVTTLITIGVILAAIGVSIGVLSAALSGLIALLTALAGTIAFAAASALPALAAAFLPAAAAVGVLIAAFQGMSDAQKKALSNDFKPLVKDLKGLASAAADVLFQDVGKWARELKPVIDSLRPGVVGVARAIRDSLGAAIDAAAESPKFEHFIERLNTFLPNAVRKLGQIFGNVFQGIGGVILAMLPAMNRFLRYIVGVTDNFADWANSRSGRQEIREFFRKAGDSAAALGDFLGEAITALGKLLDLGRGEGDGIFRDMADQIGRFVDYISSPEGQKAAKDWLKWGRELGESIGNLIVAAGDFVAAMDTPQMRAILTFLIDGFSSILGFLGKYPQAFLIMLGPIGTVAAAVITVYDGVKKVIDLIGGGDKHLAPFALDIINGAKQAAEEAANLRDTLNQVTGAVTEVTRAMAAKQLADSNALTLGAKLGLSQRTIVSAALGQKDATQQVTDALQAQFLKYGTVSQEALDFANALGITAADLRKQRQEILDNSQAIANYKGKLGGLPPIVKTRIRTDGIVPSIAGIADMIAKAKELAPGLKPRQIRTIISATGVEFTKKQIEQIIARAKKLNNQEIHPHAVLDVKPFNTDLLTVDRGLRSATGKKANPRADLDLNPFHIQMNRMLGDMNTRSRQTVKPKSDLDLNGFNVQMNSMLQSIATVPPIHVKVIVDRVPGSDTTGSTTSGDKTGGDGEERQFTTGTTGKTIAPTINVFETADGKATADEVLNRIAGLGY